MARKGFNVNGFSFSCFVLQGKFAITSGREKRNNYVLRYFSQQSQID